MLQTHNFHLNKSERLLFFYATKEEAKTFSYLLPSFSFCLIFFRSILYRNSTNDKIQEMSMKLYMRQLVPVAASTTTAMMLMHLN